MSAVHDPDSMVDICVTVHTSRPAIAVNDDFSIICPDRLERSATVSSRFSSTSRYRITTEKRPDDRKKPLGGNRVFCLTSLKTRLRVRTCARG